jgi:hypothetical protein
MGWRSRHRRSGGLITLEPQRIVAGALRRETPEVFAPSHESTATTTHVVIDDALSAVTSPEQDGTFATASVTATPR